MKGTQPIGEVLRDRAMNRLEAGPDAPWIDRAAMVARQVPAEMALFTSEDVWVRLEETGIGATAEPRAMGAVMAKLAREGLAQPTDRIRKAARSRRQAGQVRMWQSLIGGGS